MNEIITPFTCSDLPAPVAADVEAATTRIKDRLIRQVTDIIETGRDLLEVKGKLEHGQFEPWLNTSFNMTTRTAQKYMRAAEWMAGKSELSSFLTPNTIYLLSAPTTPESAQRRVLDDLEAGKPVNHREVREVVEEVKHREREVGPKKRHGKPTGVRAEKRRRKELAADFIVKAQGLCWLLIDRNNVTPLAEKTEDEINANIREFDASYKMLREAIDEARLSHGDNVTVYPPKPWGSKS